MSTMIDSKYAGKYKGASDWNGELIKAQCYDVGEGKGLDLDSLFTMAEANHLDITELKTQRGRKNAPGRLRMTIGNSLRAAAHRRGGLYGPDEKWHKADDGFMDGREVTEGKDGVSTKPKAEKREKAEGGTKNTKTKKAA